MIEIMDISHTIALALGINTQDIPGTIEEQYEQISTMFEATQERAEQLIEELTNNGVEFGTCPWLTCYSIDDVNYFATLLQDEVNKYGYVNIF